MLQDVQPHIQLSRDLNVEYALLPGDPARVEKVKNQLTNAKDLVYNREYKSVIGYYKGVKVLVLSTGIGAPSAGIAVEELANIGVHTLIRIGSCGALKDNLELGDLVIATGAVRDEGLSKSYIDSIYPAVAGYELVFSLKKAVEEMQVGHHLGIVRSHDTFYTDQENEIDAFWSRKGILGSDMETAGLFVLGGLRGLRTASVLNVVVPSKGSLENGINNFVSGEGVTARGEQNQITAALEAIASIHK
ncbi:nucleoside phosphorylase [Virgibacillus doumboii]|uniref:nucleoside phosphorylase n=1 Tax=Virgibacillus doumboii TaxID=2697503 RepID=UPI0013DFCF78|nr:nucleoside phosphorylase [Virgibacillus doumboii]